MVKNIHNLFLFCGSPNPFFLLTSACIFKNIAATTLVFCPFYIFSTSLCVCSLLYKTYHPCSPEKIMFCPDPSYKYSIITGGGYLCWFRLISWPKVLLQSSQAKGRRALGWERRACASRPCALEKSFSHYTDRTQLWGAQGTYIRRVHSCV